MVKAMVMVKHKDAEKFEGLGEQQFDVPPRVGEQIGMDDEDGQGQIYNVIAVHHPLTPTGAIDIFIKYSCGVLEEHRRINDL